MKPLILIFLFVAASLAHAALEPGCTPQTAPPGDATFDNGSFRIFEAVPYQACERSNLGYRVRRALTRLQKRGLFDTKVAYTPDILNGWPYYFLRHRIHSLKLLDEDQSQCAEHHTGAFVSPHNGPQDNDHVMYVCPELTRVTDLVVESALVHEARHDDDVSDFPHDDCNHGALAQTNLYACDKSTEFAGAYAVQTNFFIAVAKSPDVSAEERAQARALAIDYLTTRFNKLPGDLKMGVLAYTNTGEADFFDGRSLKTLVRSVPANAIVKSGEQALDFTLTESKQRESYDYKGGMVAASNPEYLELAPTTVTGTLKDYREIGEMLCVLFEHEVDCRPLDRRADWHRSILPTGSTGKKFFGVLLANAEHGFNLAVLLSTAQRQNLLMPTTFDAFRETTSYTASSAGDSHISDYVSFRPEWGFTYQGIGIVTHGNQSSVNAIDFESKAGPVPAFRTMSVRRLTGPFIWSSSMEQL